MICSKEIYDKIMKVFEEYLIDCDGDIEGCDADQLTEIEHCIGACDTLKLRMKNILWGLTSDPRGVIDEIH